jgi:hypothetical protein
MIVSVTIKLPGLLGKATVRDGRWTSWNRNFTDWLNREFPPGPSEDEADYIASPEMWAATQVMEATGAHMVEVIDVPDDEPGVY